MNQNTKLLLEACRTADEDKIIELLNNDDVDINELDKHMMTPLHYAVQRQFPIVMLELSRRSEIDPNIQNREGKTPLHLAATCSDHEVIDLILAISQSNAHFKDTQYQSPLNTAIKNNNIYFVKSLFSKSTICLKDFESYSNPIFTSAKYGKVECLQFLLRSKKIKVNLDKFYANPIVIAACNHHFECVRILLEHLADEETDEKKNILQLMFNNDIESIDKYMSRKNHTVPTSLIFGWNLLHLAVLLNNFELVSLIFTKCPLSVLTWDTYEFTPLHYAIITDSANTVRLFLHIKGLPVNGSHYENIPLSLACQYGHAECVQALLEDTRVNVNFEGLCGLRPLHYAAMKRHPNSVHVLLQNEKINTNYLDNRNTTAFSYALSKADAESVQHFLKYFFSPDKANTYPLHTAIIRDDIPSISALSADPAVDVNLTGRGYIKPLTMAVLMNNPRAVQILVNNRNIHVNSTDWNRKTALNYAVSFRHIECIKALLTHPELSPKNNSSVYLASLQCAILNDDIESLKVLLRIGEKNCTKRDFFGKNILHRCMKSIKSLDYLLSTGLFSLQERDNQGRTSFFVAAWCTEPGKYTHLYPFFIHPAAFYVLFNENNVLLTAQDRLGETVLHTAVRMDSQIAMTNLIKRNKVLLNTQLKNGHTPLHIAVLWHRRTYVETFLRISSLLVYAEDV